MTLEEALRHGIATQQQGEGGYIAFVEDHNGHYSVTSEGTSLYAECDSLENVYHELERQAPELKPTGWEWFNPISATSEPV